MSTRNCPDCDGPDLSSFFSSGGDGRCRNCHGKGEVFDIGEALYGIVSFNDKEPLVTCEVCSGTGQCQTCGGTGEVKDDESED